MSPYLEMSANPLLQFSDLPRALFALPERLRFFLRWLFLLLQRE